MSQDTVAELRSIAAFLASRGFKDKGYAVGLAADALATPPASGSPAGVPEGWRLT